MNEWKPIETAPKDGSLLIFYWSDVHNQPWQCERGYCLGFWSDPLTSGGGTVEEYSGWYDCETAGNALSPQPTLWAPLLEPPQTVPGTHVFWEGKEIK
jgi:hypothetical protein